MLNDSRRGCQLFRLVVVLDSVGNCYGVRLTVHETELEALVADEHRHSLNRYRVDRVREIVEEGGFNQGNSLLSVPEPTFRKLNGGSIVILDRYLLAFQVFQFARYAV